MPGGDGSGPFGTGPRGGFCLGAGLRRGLGAGRGRGFGTGYGRGVGGIFPADAQSRKQILENRASILEQELAALKKQLSDEGGQE